MTAFTFTAPRTRLWAARYFALFVMLVLTTYFAISMRLRIDSRSTSVVFLHLSTFAAHFGAQCWVTFVAGLTMFYNLPRIMFGQVQKQLFPMYFASTLALSSITLATYTARHPYDTWTRTDGLQVCILALCVISTFVNTFFFAPEIVETMLQLFEMEKGSGVAYVIGYVDRTELKKNPEYNQTYRKFRMNHGMSAIANITTLVCNTMYLYHIASQCAILDII